MNTTNFGLSATRDVVGTSGVRNGCGRMVDYPDITPVFEFVRLAGDTGGASSVSARKVFLPSHCPRGGLRYNSSTYQIITCFSLERKN